MLSYVDGDAAAIAVGFQKQKKPLFNIKSRLIRKRESGRRLQGQGTFWPDAFTNVTKFGCSYFHVVGLGRGRERGEGREGGREAGERGGGESRPGAANLSGTSGLQV